jgi:hypothetical protein
MTADIGLYPPACARVQAGAWVRPGVPFAPAVTCIVDLMSVRYDDQTGVFGFV